MRAGIELLQRERAARRFLLAVAQSALGTGAALVAIPLVAYARWHSPWALTLALLGPQLAPTLLAPFLGALVDRFPRRTCLVVADVAGAAAFAAMAVVPSFALTVALAIVAGAASSLFVTAALAGIPNMVAPERAPAATALFGTLEDLGMTAGPALAGVLLALLDARGLLLANAATFAVSAVLIGGLALPAAASAWPGGSLLREAAAGLRALRVLPGVFAIVLATAVLSLFGGLLTVNELPFAHALHAGSGGFAALVTVYGGGLMAGSLLGAGGSGSLTRRFVAGALLFGAALAATGLAPDLPLALLGYAVAGVGNGLLVVTGRLLVQRTVPDHLRGRIFGLRHALTSAATTLAFVAAGGLLTEVSAGTVLIVAGAGSLAVAGATALSLGEHRQAWPATALAHAGAGAES